MTRYAARLDTAFTLAAQDDYVGTLDDGYFVTLNNSSFDMFLRSVDDPTTTIGTVVGGYGSYYHTQNDAGDVYYIGNVSSTSKSINHVTQSGGVLSVSNNGTATNVPFAGIFDKPPMLSHDGSQLIIYGSDNIVYGITTATAGSAFHTNISAHAGNVIGMPAPDRFINYCYADDEFELWDGPNDTLLDTLAGDMNESFRHTFMPTGPNRLFGAWRDGVISAAERIIGTIDATGDSLSWVWTPRTITTDWAGDALGAYVACWGSVAAIMPASTSLSGGGSMYVIDTTTGQVGKSPASPYVDAVDNGRAVGFAGPTRVVAFHTNGTNGWTSWTVVPADATLRQRQSPRRSPSRVDYPNLRQRQTPYIR